MTRIIHGFAGCKVHSEPSSPVCAITAYGKRMTRAAVMTLAQIEATAAANGWRVWVGECVG